MSTVEQSTIACPACGKKYRWKPETAGRKAKCACGQMITMPAAAASAGNSATGAADADPLYDLVEDELVRPKKASPVASPPPAAANPSAPRAVLPANGPSIPLPPGVRPPKRDPAADAEANKAAILKLLIPLGLVVLLVIAVVSYRLLSRATRETTPKLGDDALVEEMIRDNYGTEAREWLKASSMRTVMGMTRSQADKRAVSFYDMGAKRVYAFDAVMSSHLAIELPDDPAQRAKLFAFEKQWHLDMYVEPAKDVGQKYLLLRMRL